MGGWSADGLRVLQGSTIVTESRVVLAGITWTYQTRSVTTERAEWRGLTAAGAAAKTATATWTIISRERVDETDQWRVREEKITTGAWA